MKMELLDRETPITSPATRGMQRGTVLLCEHMLTHTGKGVCQRSSFRVGVCEGGPSFAPVSVSTTSGDYTRND
jgi:hypothetical protein